MKKSIFIVAGGTGGHINAALSLGEFFSDKYNVNYISGIRHLDYKLFKGTNCYQLNMQPLRVKNILKLFINTFKNTLSFFYLIWLMLIKRPAFVIGAGGYVCGPTFLAAKLFLKPTFIVEQNAVAGLTNKILAKISSLVFTNFENTKGFENIDKEKLRPFGNPIRATIERTDNILGDELNLLVFGGSLGATQINESLQEVINSFSVKKVNIIHQIGKNNKPLVCDNKLINYQGYEYLDDIEKEYKWANIIISRAGASTISELRVVRKPSILIPFPAAVDNHQYYNALELKKENLSYIAVLDHKKSSLELAKDIKDEINKIYADKLFYSSDKEFDIAVEKIGSEILNYVRN